ncbi:MAG TPA: hypothetical protein VLF71_04220 [Candidatus Saccharimonadales bacterium]|nr:hypothetical protein [Candidatus Saccharimonadales bacterium]
MALDTGVRPEANALLASVAEQLKVPLAVIARHAELGSMGGAAALDANLVATQADAALLLVDSYLLGLELLRAQTRLELEPVSVSSLLVDTAHDLHRFARQYGVDVQLETAGKYGPVMGNARGLKAALLSLGFALVEAQPALGGGARSRISLALHRTPQGIVAGVYSARQVVSADAWRRAQELCGAAAQPFTELGAGTAAGLFVADAILRSMDSRLRVGHYLRRGGLAATLQPSRQLQLV